MHELTTATQLHSDHLAITLTGEMDLSTCPTLEQDFLVMPLDDKRIRVDLSGVSFMDSTGLNLLLRLRTRLISEGGHLVLSRLPDQVTRLLQMTGAYELLTASPVTSAR